MGDETGGRLEAGCIWSAGLSAGAAAALGVFEALPRRGRVERPECAEGGDIASTWCGSLIFRPACTGTARADAFQRRDRQSLDAH
jgi:hypothetical protein